MNELERHFNEALGEKLRRVRRSNAVRRLTQEALALKVGLTRTSVVNMERGRQGVSTFKLAQIAKVLGVEVAALVPQLADLTDRRAVVNLNNVEGLDDLNEEERRLTVEWMSDVIEDGSTGGQLNDTTIRVGSKKSKRATARRRSRKTPSTG